MAHRVTILDDGNNGYPEGEGQGMQMPALDKPTSSLFRNRIAELFRSTAAPKELYQAGLEDGGRSGVESLTDILFFLRDKRLGRMSVLEESNCHAVFKVYDCVCCELGTGQNCHYMAGFLAGALRVTGRPETVKVQEVSCGGGPGCDCVFEANW